MTVPIRSMDDRYELYRVVLDYEALQESFLDRIDDLNVSLSEIDAEGGMTRGNAQRLLTKSEGKPRKDRPSSSSRRTFGWESLGKMLKGTRTVLALMVDKDQPPADLKPRSMRGGAVLLKRKREAERSLSIGCQAEQSPEIRAQLELKQRMSELGKRGAKRRMQTTSKRARQRAASHAARKRWAKRQ